MTLLQRSEQHEVRNHLCKLYSFKEEKARYRKNYLGWDNIGRANNDKLCRKKALNLSKDAQAILAPVVQKLEKGKRVFLNHKYISTITKCERGQNRNIIKQLETVLDITYHNSITHEGKKHRHSYEFAYYKQEIVSQEDNSTAQFIERGESLNHNNQASCEYFIIENKDIEDIDLESKFLQNSEEIKIEETSELKVSILSQKPVKPAKLKKRLSNERKKPTKAQAKAKVYKPFAYDKPKTLANMLPLIDRTTCDELRSRSGRSFTDNFIIQLVLKMSKNPKITARFDYKKGFIAYMAGALRYELHDAVKTGNINFRLKANIPGNNNETPEQQKPPEALKPEPLKLPEGTWGDICHRLIAVYDEYVYRNWLSKLNPVIDESSKFITLQAPNSFIRQQIETNYGDSINKLAESMGLEFKGVSQAK
jgi:hypothetical protein